MNLLSSKPLQTFVAVIVLGAFVGPLLGFWMRPGYWAVVVVLAGLAALARTGLLGGSGATGLGVGGGGGFLCDTCKYNHPNTCSIPDRPNATRCSDFKRRGS